MDYTEVVRHVEKNLGAEWTDANAVFNRTLDDGLEASRRRREAPTRLYRKVHAEVGEAFVGEWSSPQNPLLSQLPTGLTVEQCRKLAHLIASRKPGPLYLALLVQACRLEAAAAARGVVCDAQDHATEAEYKVCRVCNP